MSSMAAREETTAHDEGPLAPISPKAYDGGPKGAQRRRRRHPVAEIKGGWTAEEDAKLRECAPLSLASVTARDGCGRCVGLSLALAAAGCCRSD